MPGEPLEGPLPTSSAKLCVVMPTWVWCPTWMTTGGTIGCVAYMQCIAYLGWGLRQALLCGRREELLVNQIVSLKVLPCSSYLLSKFTHPPNKHWTNIPMGNNHPNFRIHLDIVIFLHKPPHPQQQHTELAPICCAFNPCLSHFTFISMEIDLLFYSLSLSLSLSLFSVSVTLSLTLFSFLCIFLCFYLFFLSTFLW